MTAKPDLLRFNIHGQTHILGWEGPWPPPDELTVVYGHLTGEISVTDWDNLDPVLRAEVEEAPSLEVIVCKRGDTSKLPDDADMDHVVRGAEYAPKEVLQ